MSCDSDGVFELGGCLSSTPDEDASMNFLIRLLVDDVHPFPLLVSVFGVSNFLDGMQWMGRFE